MHAFVIFYILHLLVALAGHLGGSCGLCRVFFLAEFSFRFFSSEQGQSRESQDVYVRESEIDRFHRRMT